MSLSEEKGRELVLSVTQVDVARLFASKGATGSLIPVHEDDVSLWLEKAAIAFLPRSIVENDAAWRHFATYAILHDDGRYFVYRRGSSGSEGRLHGSLSLGVGGHVGIDDYVTRRKCDEMMLCHAAIRELDEELERSIGSDWTFVGLIADGSSRVNQVHIGVVYVVNCKSDTISPREDCLADPQWLTAAELRARRDEMEVWSQIVLDRLIGGQS